MPDPAFWLPALPDPPLTTVRLSERPRIEVQTVDWSPALIRATARDLRAARREILVHLSIRRILELVDRVGQRFLDAGDPIRAEALRSMVEVTGYSRAMAEHVLDGMAADWRADPLEAALLSDLGGMEVLDRFVGETPASQRYAVGPELCFHVFSGNVPGVAVMSLIRSLLVRSASLAKTAAGEPSLPVLFARALAEAEPVLGRCLAIGYWKGGARELEVEAMETADTVIAYGSDRSIGAIRAQLPGATRLIEYGTRFSVGLVLREALEIGLAAQSARDAALAVATFDQQGCVSPHALLVERGGEIGTAEWAEMLGKGMAELQRELPRGRITDDEAAAIQQFRARAQFSSLGGAESEIHQSAGTEWTVLHEPVEAVEASCLNRTVRVIPIDDANDALHLLTPVGGVLQSIGFAGPRERIERIAPALARIGASRIVPLGRLPWPPPRWHHDGGQPFADLIRWCDLETP